LQLNNLTGLNLRSPINICISGGKISSIGPDNNMNSDPFQIHFRDALVMPGLTNSHDHLDFNCFNILGQRKYSSYVEWGKHIHEIYHEQINAVLKIPQNVRASWGIYKNLIAGVTTVVNHGSYLKITAPLINIRQETQDLHSVQFEHKWKWKLNNPFLIKKDCVIHTGEGADKQSSDEISELLKYNYLKRNLVGVHGVAMDAFQARGFKGLIWCPESNYVLLNKQADIQRIKSHTRIVFGTDSTLTGDWNIWQHLRLARSLKVVSDEELFNMVTRSPAALWNLNNGELLPDKEADIVITKKSFNLPFLQEIFLTNPEDLLIVIQGGRIRMFDESLFPQINNHIADISKYNCIRIKGILKYVEGDLKSVTESIKHYCNDFIFPFEVCS
jgi:cytosine/adenosine deaminase-related metal-dependent hydrolase